MDLRKVGMAIPTLHNNSSIVSAVRPSLAQRRLQRPPRTSLLFGSESARMIWVDSGLIDTFQRGACVVLWLSSQKKEFNHRHSIWSILSKGNRSSTASHQLLFGPDITEFCCLAIGTTTKFGDCRLRRWGLPPTIFANSMFSKSTIPYISGPWSLEVGPSLQYIPILQIIWTILVMSSTWKRNARHRNGWLNERLFSMSRRVRHRSGHHCSIIGHSPYDQTPRAWLRTHGIVWDFSGS